LLTLRHGLADAGAASVPGPGAYTPAGHTLGVATTDKLVTRPDGGDDGVAFHRREPKTEAECSWDEEMAAAMLARNAATKGVYASRTTVAARDAAKHGTPEHALVQRLQHKVAGSAPRMPRPHTADMGLASPASFGADFNIGEVVSPLHWVSIASIPHTQLLPISSLLS
jgi:hypothetical protein